MTVRTPSCHPTSARCQHRQTEEANAGSAQGGVAAAGVWRVTGRCGTEYGLSKATVSRMVRSARLSGGLEAGLAMQCGQPPVKRESGL